VGVTWTGEPGPMSARLAGLRAGMQALDTAMAQAAATLVCGLVERLRDTPPGCPDEDR
jgi:hypothetical protein